MCKKCEAKGLTPAQAADHHFRWAMIWMGVSLFFACLTIALRFLD